MNAWRFSIEWSRVEPEEGTWNPEAIEHYRTYIQTLQKVGIEPVVTFLALDSASLVRKQGWLY